MTRKICLWIMAVVTVVMFIFELSSYDALEYLGSAPLSFFDMYEIPPLEGINVHILGRADVLFRISVPFSPNTVVPNILKLYNFGRIALLILTVLHIIRAIFGAVRKKYRSEGDGYMG